MQGGRISLLKRNFVRHCYSVHKKEMSRKFYFSSFVYILLTYFKPGLGILKIYNDRILMHLFERRLTYDQWIHYQI